MSSEQNISSSANNPADKDQQPAKVTENDLQQKDGPENIRNGEPVVAQPETINPEPYEPALNAARALITELKISFGK